MIVADLDLGGRPAYLLPRGAGIALGSAMILGSRTIAWPAGGTLPGLDVAFWITAWQSLGGNQPKSLVANRLLRRQLKELSQNPLWQPCYIRWAASADPEWPSRADPDDGWYAITDVSWDPETYNQAGSIQARMTVARLAEGTAPQTIWYSGGQLASTYSAPSTPLLAFPIGASGIPGTVLNRISAEGIVPGTVLQIGGLNPVPLVPPAASALYKGSCRVFDTMSPGGNAPPMDGTYLHPSWVEVKDSTHTFAGDCLATNGLVLLVFQAGTQNLPLAYFWNTQLGTAAWQLVGWIGYQDNAGLAGTLRDYGLDRVGPEEVGLTVRASTSSGQWARLRMRLQRGRPETRVEFGPMTQANGYGYALIWNLNSAAKVAFTEANVLDAVTNPGGLPPTSGYGYACIFGLTANGPLIGWLFATVPGGGQGNAASSSGFGFGDTGGPAQGAYRTYAFFAAPFTSAQNLQAEAESGTLGTGWSSVADGAASGGNTAKVASGTATGNADLFGTSFVPQNVPYDVWFRVKVTSTAGGGNEMQLGWWDVTSSSFLASTTYAPNSAGIGTSYAWVRVAHIVTPTAGHSMRFRGATVATIGTDWFVDQAVAVPAGVAQDSIPADLFAQFMFDRVVERVLG